MFGINKGKIKEAFADFNRSLVGLPASKDPLVNLIVRFIQKLSEAF